jgi:hypothetical protein
MLQVDSRDIDSITVAMSVFFRSGGTRVMLLALFLLVVSYQLLYQWTVSAVFTVGGGFFAWGLAEWLIHKYLMHRKKLPLLPEAWNLCYRVHQEHHRDPGNMQHALLRAWPVVVADCLVALVVGAAFFSFGLSLLAGISFFLIAINYNFVHFLSHTSVETRLPLLKQALDNHRLHHEGKRGGYGLSNIWMDYVMGTRLKRP